MHEAAAATNLALCDRLSTDPGWLVTVMYYAAIQKIEARLADRNEHPTTPDARRTAGLSIESKIGAPWRKLKQLSEDWRYAGLTPSPNECRDAERWAADMAAYIGERWPEAK